MDIELFSHVVFRSGKPQYLLIIIGIQKIVLDLIQDILYKIKNPLAEIEFTVKSTTDL